MFETRVAEKFKTHVLYSIIFFPPENRPIYEIVWKNMIGRYWPQMAMRLACRMTTGRRQTDTHTLYLILSAFNTAAVDYAKTPLNVTLYEGWNFNSGNYLFTTGTK